MGGKKDIVEQALKLVIGGTDEPAKNALRLYHGTKSPEPFPKLDPSQSEFGVHFGTPEQANTFATPYSGGDVEPGSRVIPMDVTLSNPVRLQDYGRWDADVVYSQLADRGILPLDLKLLDKYSNEPHSPEYHKEIQDMLRSSGHDSIVYLNRREGVPSDIPDYLLDDYGDEAEIPDDVFKRHMPGAADSYIVWDEDKMKSPFGEGPGVGFNAGGRTGYQTKGRVVGDAVDAAMRLIAGAEPQKTAKAYKLFKQREGKLYPLFVDANEEVPLNQWLKAKAGEQAASGQVKSKAGPLAYRPGWHAGDLPVATHIGAKAHGNKRLPPDTRRSDEVWAEVEMADDVDWQKIADERARITKKGTPDPKTAHITDQVPYGGYYRYKTSPTMQGNWMIGGDMRVNRVLTDDEVKAINDAAGVSDLPRREGYGGGGEIVEKALKFLGNIGRDNPALKRESGKEWLAEKQRHSGPKGIRGADTAWTREPVDMPLDLLSGVKGARDETRVPGDPQYDDLLAKVQQEGWNPDPISIVVNHRGEPFIYEGNTRSAVGRATGQSTVPAEIHWMNGAEMAPGQWSPEALAEFLANREKQSGGRAGYGPGGVIDDIVKMAGKIVSGADEPVKTGIRAYQGSPHNFAAERLVRFPDKTEQYIVGTPDVLPDVPEGAEVIQDFPLGRMRMDKIGTGEGAQAYGHGLYTAENEKIARSYRDALAAGVKPEFRPTDKYSTVGWKAEAEKLFPNDRERQAAFHLFNQMKNKDYVLENHDFITSLPHNQGKPYEWEGVEFTRDRLAQLADEFYDPGHMYEVNINADPNTFLDWDKPLSEQPNLMRALGNYDPEYYVDYDEIIDKAMRSLRPVSEPTGEDIYRALGHPKTATRMLNTMGVPGIRYLDAGSRGAGDGTRNIVVFDDKLISIIRKYGIAGASAMLGYNLMENLSPEQARAATAADNAYQSSGVNTGGMLPPGMEPSGELTSRTPTASDRVYDYIRANLLGDEATKGQRAETVMNVLDNTPATIPLIAYDLMRGGAEALAASMADQEFQSSRPQRSMGGNNSVSGALNVARGLQGGM